MHDERLHDPHVSLLYGNYNSDVIETAKNKVEIPVEEPFFVDKIYLYKTEGEAGSWQKIQEFICMK